MLAESVTWFQCYANPEKLITFPFPQGSKWNHQMLCSRSQQAKWTGQNYIDIDCRDYLSQQLRRDNSTRLEKLKCGEIYGISSIVCTSANCKISMANDSFYFNAHMPVAWPR